MASTARIGPQAAAIDALRAATVAQAEVPAAPWADRALETSHGRVAVRETTGVGLPLVLVHGNSGCKDVFRGQLCGALGARHRMVAVDLPGHGASDDALDPARSYTITGYADLVVEVTEILGLARYALLGWSLGGHVALEACASAPGVAGVMTVGAPPIGATAETIVQAFMPGPLVGLGLKAELSDDEVATFAAAAGIARDPVLVAAIRRADGRARATVMADALAGGASDERAIVESMRIPLAVIDGAEDPFVHGAYVDGLRYGSLWEGRRHAIPRVGHAPFLAAPEVFNAILARFLRYVEGRADDGHGFGTCLGG